MFLSVFLSLFSDPCFIICFKYLLTIFSKVERADGEMDERFWDVLLNADRKDHERICTEFGVADLQLILKKLEAKKEERMQNKFKV